jgi:hypothetical protein
VPRALFLLAALLVQTASADVRDRVWVAVQPALPFPLASEDHVPIDGSTTARWIVRRARSDEGDLVAEVLANPLNEEAQGKAAQDMAAIQQEVFAAERRAQEEFERARETARRTGEAVSIHGVTLDDEGVAGDRADAEERMTIEVEEGRAEHSVRVDAVEAPSLRAMQGADGWIVLFPARELAGTSNSRGRYLPAEAIVYPGAAKPAVSKEAERVFAVRATGDRVVAVTLRGNDDLIDQVLTRTDWSRLSARDR